MFWFCRISDIASISLRHAAVGARGMLCLLTKAVVINNDCQDIRDVDASLLILYKSLGISKMAQLYYIF